MNVILPGFSERMKQIRRDHNLTQNNMANVIGKTLRHYQAIEAGTVNVPATMLLFLSQEFHVSVDYLLGLSDELRPPLTVSDPAL